MFLLTLHTVHQKWLSHCFQININVTLKLLDAHIHQSNVPPEQTLLQVPTRKSCAYTTKHYQKYFVVLYFYKIKIEQNS
jgi:hypothetical protein